MVYCTRSAQNFVQEFNQATVSVQDQPFHPAQSLEWLYHNSGWFIVGSFPDANMGWDMIVKHRAAAGAVKLYWIREQITGPLLLLWLRWC